MVTSRIHITENLFIQEYDGMAITRIQTLATLDLFLFWHFRPDNFHGLLHKGSIDLQETSAGNRIPVPDAPLVEFYYMVQSIHRYLSGICPVPLSAL